MAKGTFKAGKSSKGTKDRRTSNKWARENAKAGAKASKFYEGTMSRYAKGNGKGKGKGWKGDFSGHQKAAKKAWDTRIAKYGKSGRKGGKPVEAPKSKRQKKLLHGTTSMRRKTKKK